MTLGPFIPLPNFVPTPLGNDALVKDEKVPLSELLRRNGWGGKDSPLNETARGVIGCESSDNPEAENNSPCAAGEHAVGLMQVCTVNRGKYGIPKDRAKAVEWLKVADNNVSAGRSIQRAQGWGAWTCPKTRRKDDPIITAKKHSVTGEIGGAINDAVDAVTSPIEVVADFLGLLTQSSTWFRVGKVWLGGVLIIFGAGALILAGGKTVAKGPVGRVVAKATPAGKIAGKVT